MHEGGRRARRPATATCRALKAVGSTGSPLSPEGFALGLRARRAPTPGCSRPAAAPTCAPRSSAASRRCRSTWASCRPARWAPTSQAWDPDGRPLIGEVGELVITEPMPSMPVFFWGDEDGSRLRESYFEHYPGVWRHGDWIEITERGTAIIYGRSDSTINRGGIRMGTSEIYRAVLAEDDVVDALVVDVPKAGTEGWMPLFVVLRDGVRARRRAGQAHQDAHPRGLLAAPRPQRDPPGRRGPAHAERQGPRGPGQAHPHGPGPRPGRRARLAGQPRRRSTSSWTLAKDL